MLFFFKLTSSSYGYKFFLLTPLISFYLGKFIQLSFALMKIFSELVMKKDLKGFYYSVKYSPANLNIHWWNILFYSSIRLFSTQTIIKVIFHLSFPLFSPYFLIFILYFVIYPPPASSFPAPASPTTTLMRAILIRQRNRGENQKFILSLRRFVIFFLLLISDFYYKKIIPFIWICFITY